MITMSEQKKPLLHSRHAVLAWSSGAVALIAAWYWHITEAPVLCRVLDNQTPGCAGLAYRHNIAAIVALALVTACIVCARKRL